MRSETNQFNTVIRSRRSQLEYRLNIEHKYTIIQGDSGIGKTTLIGLLDLCSSRLNRQVYTLESEYRFVKFPVVRDEEQLSSDDWLRAIDNYIESMFPHSSVDSRYIVLYCDEDYTALKLRNFQEALSKMDYCCMIVTRGVLSNLPYGVEDIYTVVNVGDKKHIVQRMYPDSFKFPQGEFSLLKTEDEGSGKDFFAEYLNKVKSAGGKNKIISDLSVSDHTLYVADSLGFGSVIAGVLGDLEKYPTNGLWLIKSFEYLLLNSSLLKNKSILYQVNQYQARNGKTGYSSIPEEVDLFCPRKEDFYEHQLRDIMCALGQTYSKHKRNLEKSEFGIGKCFLQNCCDHFNEHSKKYEDPCELYTRGDKFGIILGKELADKLRAMFGDKREITDILDEESAEDEEDSDSPLGFTSVFK